MFVWTDGIVRVIIISIYNVDVDEYFFTSKFILCVYT